jgi:hypothetical protein
MGRSMDEKQRLAGFKALVESYRANSYYLEEVDGSLNRWPDLSAEAKLEYIIGDAVRCDVPFADVAKSVREYVDGSAIEEAALRLAMRNWRELHEVEKILPDYGRLESSPPLVERVSELLKVAGSERETEAWPTAAEHTALFAEMRADEVAGKREDAHSFGKETFDKILEVKAESPAVDTGRDRGIEW